MVESSETAPDWIAGAQPLLGWRGAAVLATVAGTEVVGVIRIDDHEDRRRRSAGLLPAADPHLLGCMLATGKLGSLPPLSVQGFLVAAHSWKTGAAAVAGLSAFAAGVVVLSRMPSRHALLDADLRGLGLVLAGNACLEVLVPPAVHDPPKATRMQRLVQEELYAAVLRSEQLTGASR